MDNLGLPYIGTAIMCLHDNIIHVFYYSYYYSLYK